jgi:hypothetical protein
VGNQYYPTTLIVDYEHWLWLYSSKLEYRYSTVSFGFHNEQPYAQSRSGLSSNLSNLCAAGLGCFNVAHHLTYQGAKKTTITTNTKTTRSLDYPTIIYTLLWAPNFILPSLEALEPKHVEFRPRKSVYAYELANIINTAVENVNNITTASLV